MFRVLFFSILMGFSSLVFADTYPATTTQEWQNGTVNCGGCDGHFQGSASSICNQIKPYYSGYVSVSPVTITGSDFLCRLVRSDSTTADTTRFYYTPTYSCPYGGTVSGSSCVGAPACPDTYTRDAVTGECKPPARVCSSTEYDTGTACAPIPDCNADQPLGRYFFDITTKACATTNTVGTICINEAQKYCPPIDDCKDPGYICTNQPAAVEAAAATRQAEIDAAKAKADAVKAEIAAAAAAAAQAAQSKEAAAAKAKADKEAAAAALAAANASGVQSAIDAAIQAYSEFASDYIDSLAKSANSSAAQQKASDIDGQAGTEVDAIPSSVPGNAEAHKDNVEGLLPSVTRALDDAVTGNGNGNGAGSGEATKDSPSIDTSKLNKEETQQSIDTSLKGIKDALGAPSTGESDTTLADVDKGVKDAMQGVVDDVNGVDTSLGTNPAAAVGMTSSYWSYAQGTCYPHEFDLGQFGSVSLDKFCSIYDEHIRPLLVLVLGFFGVLHVWSYWASIIAMSI